MLKKKLLSHLNLKILPTKTSLNGLKVMMVLLKNSLMLLVAEENGSKLNGLLLQKNKNLLLMLLGILLPKH